MQFVEDNFDDEGLELESWTPEDWTPNPEFIGKLKKPALRGLAKRINRLWKDLSRKIKEDVKAHPSLYSIIYVPNGFIVPGGKNCVNTKPWRPNKYYQMSQKEIGYLLITLPNINALHHTLGFEIQCLKTVSCGGQGAQNNGRKI